MNQQQYTQGTAEYVDTLIRRLLERYLTSEALPGSAEKTLTPALVHALSRSIMAEGYGE